MKGCWIWSQGQHLTLYRRERWWTMALNVRPPYQIWCFLFEPRVPTRFFCRPGSTVPALIVWSWLGQSSRAAGMSVNGWVSSSDLPACQSCLFLWTLPGFWPLVFQMLCLISEPLWKSPDHKLNAWNFRSRSCFLEIKSLCLTLVCQGKGLVRTAFPSLFRYGT